MPVSLTALTAAGAITINELATVVNPAEAAAISAATWLAESIAPNLVDMASSSSTHAAKKTSGDHWYAPDPVSAPFTSVSIAAQPTDSLHKMQRAEGARQHTIDDLAVADLILRSSRSLSSCTEAVALSTLTR